MQTTMNLKIKFRESFRPFAPAVLSDAARDYFDLDQDSPYMLLVTEVAKSQRLSGIETVGLTGLELLRMPRSTIPAVTHVDSSARVQTVDGKANPLFHRLLTAFHERSGGKRVTGVKRFHWTE
ncbi:MULTISPECIES: carbamoyltransferase C-terminal domain-containing protein [Streptomyces]|uniref:carbamoyltransferase C-terminal domain-containing protein n=1 Tax=Streptomyces TaxID=1883 RepID=UPI0033D99B3A